MAKFADGDVVQLKSGGPVMTVQFSDETRGVACQWFERGGKSQKVHSEYFPEASLVKFTPPKPITFTF